MIGWKNKLEIETKSAIEILHNNNEDDIYNDYLDILFDIFRTYTDFDINDLLFIIDIIDNTNNDLIDCLFSVLQFLLGE